MECSFEIKEEAQEVLFLYINEHNLVLHVKKMYLTQAYIDFLPMSVCGLGITNLFLEEREGKTGTVNLSWWPGCSSRLLGLEISFLSFKETKKFRLTMLDWVFILSLLMPSDLSTSWPKKHSGALMYLPMHTHATLFGIWYKLWNI